ncbi:hypothetical protein RCIP0012_00127 [Klebsiella phage RCIP0012]
MPVTAYFILYMVYAAGFLYVAVNTDVIWEFIHKQYMKIKTRYTRLDIDSIIKQARSRTRQ